jgi:hypothetical protein
MPNSSITARERLACDYRAGAIAPGRHLPPCWNEPTRQITAHRLSLGREPRFFSRREFATLQALCARLQPGLSPAQVAAQIDEGLRWGNGDPRRHADLPPQDEAWCAGLGAIEAEALDAYGLSFAELDPSEQDRLIGQLAAGDRRHTAWGAMPPALFFRERVQRDIRQACDWQFSAARAV